ncbi:MAG: NIL domain-containing protein [Vulcanimicrobiota bacterium]
MQRSVYMHFSNELVNKPILSALIRKYDVDINILEARVTPDEEGFMFIQMIGNEDNLDKAFGFLVSSGVNVTVKPQRLIWDEEICTSCGACVGQCLPKALHKDEETGKVKYDQEKCIACFLCIKACPYSAVREVEQEVV